MSESVRNESLAPVSPLSTAKRRSAFSSLRAQGFSDDAYGTEGAKLAKQKRNRSGLMKFLGECSNGRLLRAVDCDLTADRCCEQISSAPAAAL